MPKLLERGAFVASLVLGRMLRSAKYSTVNHARRGGTFEVRKRRAFYAPLLIWMGAGLLRLLDTGVRILPQGEWREREDEIYRRLYATSTRVDVGGTLVLPCLSGATLAAVLEDSALDESAKDRATDLAAAALAAFHRQGWTHADAMAENVLVDLAAGVARWFDFETVHEPHRPVPWRRADDVRALLATCLLRTGRAHRQERLQRILDVYADDGVTREVRHSFASALRRPLVFHLAQAPLSFECFREIARRLDERAATMTADGRHQTC